MDTILAFLILIISIIIHEVAHGYAADTLGDPTARLSGRLTLNPVPHVDMLGSVFVPALLVLSGSSMLFGWAKPVPYNPYNLRNQRFGEALVAVAGSATNILIAIIFGLVLRFGADTLPAAALSLAATIAFINLFLGLFNLIPFPPLDGFTVIRALSPWNISVRFAEFEQKIRSMGILFLVLFLFVFSTVLAVPFLTLVSRLFGFITGIGIP